MNLQSLFETLKDPFCVRSLPGSEGFPARARGESLSRGQHRQSIPKPQGFDPRFIYSKDSSITLIWMQHLWGREWRQAGAYLLWGWQLILSDSVSGCWAALHQTHLQCHQAVALLGVNHGDYQLYHPPRALERDLNELWATRLPPMLPLLLPPVAASRS